jgi:hypothetical protein
MKHSILDIPAVYSVSEELVSPSAMITMWLGWCENELVGCYTTRVEAECRCRWHYAESLVAEDMLETI